MRQILILILLLVMVCKSMAQQDNVVMRFLDAVNEQPLYGVSILDSKGTKISKSDSQGYCIVPFGNINSDNYLLALHPGYSADTIRNPVSVFYLQPLSVTMNTAIIRANKVKTLLREPDEYVVDYLFAGDNIVVATWSGNNGRNAKLFLLNKEGDLLARCKIPKEPLGLYKSCIGNYYCICSDIFYPISISGTEIALKHPYSSKLLEGLQQCEHSVNGNLYYRIGDRANFRMSYGMIAKGDSIFKPMVEFEEADVAAASYEEWLEIQALKEDYRFTSATQKAGMRHLLNKGSYAHINIPLFSSADSLVIFDYLKKRILFYNLAGRPLGQSPVRFEWTQSQRFEIIKDEQTNRFYIHRFSNPNFQTLEELDINTGSIVSNKIEIVKPFPGQVRVENGDIYFLYQNGKAGGVRQLFVQHENLATSISVTDK